MYVLCMCVMFQLYPSAVAVVVVVVVAICDVVRVGVDVGGGAW